MRRWTWLALTLVGLAGAAHAADEATLKKLVAPAPIAIGEPLAGKTTQAIRLARVVVQLKPEPWALIRQGSHSQNGIIYGSTERLVSWRDGEQVVKTATFADIFDEELIHAGSNPDTAGSSVFEKDSTANLLLGVKVTEMEGNFCKYCVWHTGERWIGAVVMGARWEVYSSLERKVVATIDTAGGFNQGVPGLDGEPDRLINEAFRDNARRLIASDQFQRILTAPLGPSPSHSGAMAPASQSILALVANRPAPTLPLAANSVAVVFSNDGSGSAFLVSDEGYLLTNQHVVGAAKYVKLKWSDGSETLGEVIRSDPRRDVALVKADAGGRAALGLRPGPAQQGETVFAIGSPLGERYQNTMSKGIVSALRTSGGMNFVQSDAMINHGSSGGPLIDDTGRVIAMTVSMKPADAPTDIPIGLNFFIPIDDALRVLNLAAPPSSPAQLRAAVAPPKTKEVRKP